MDQGRQASLRSKSRISGKTARGKGARSTAPGTRSRRSGTSWFFGGGPHLDIAGELAFALSVAAIAYALLAGLRTLTDFDLGWQLATGRWVAQHHQIPSTDVFSYTAQGQPWIYPVGSGLVFYAAFLLGNYALLSWLGAAACAGTVVLLVWRRSAITAGLAILAIPLIAIRIRPRADMFTVVLFAAFLALLWRQHESGRARLWLLPILMIAWVNLHLGFMAGLALLGGYVMVEALEMVWPKCRQAAAARLRRSWPWLLASFGATFLNPWGWGIWRALVQQEGAMAAHSQWITEWVSVPVDWNLMATGFSVRNTGGAFYLLLLIAAVAVPVAVLRRQLGAAVLLMGAALLAIRHVRFEALFSIVMVVAAGAVFTSALEAGWAKIKHARSGLVFWSKGLALAAAVLVAALACIRGSGLVTDRSYLGATDLGSFGSGLSWWFPERAAAFLERENIPGQIFNTYNEGGYIVWRLGPKYLDYIDGRAIPFGPGLFERNIELMATPPESPEWRREAERYDINAIIVPLGRYYGLPFPVLQEFCAGDAWRPVYLDEVSAVFVRRRPENASLIARLQIDCAAAPLPAVIPEGNDSAAFNHWANAAAVLLALGRTSEAFVATSRALAIFPDSAFIHYLRGNLEEAGDFGDAQEEYLQSVALEPNGATWSTLAAVYRREGRLSEEIGAWEHAAELLPRPGSALLSLGFANLDAHHPQKALEAFDRARASVQEQSGVGNDSAFNAKLAHGRAIAWGALGDTKRAVSLEEEAVRLNPESFDEWVELANLYESEGRAEDAQQARARASAVAKGQNPASPQH
jgi:Flp pilus assembly protein TadD